MQITGQVQNVVARETSVGTFYDIVVNGKKYGHGKFAPRGIQSGDFVTFEVDVKQNGKYTNYDIRKGTLRKDETPAKEDTQPAPSQRSSGYGRKFVDNSFDSRQETISKQAALNTALTFCNLAASTGAVPAFPKTAKEADKLGLLYNWVLETAQGFYKLSTGNEWSIPSLEPTTLVEKPKANSKAAKSEAPFEESGAEDSGFDEYT